METKNAKLKIFNMDDCEWWVADSKESAIEAYIKEYGADEMRGEMDAHELNEDELHSHTYLLDVHDKSKGEMSFAQRLSEIQAHGITEPQMFATSEF